MADKLQQVFAPVLYVVIFFLGFLTAAVWFNPNGYPADFATVLTAVAALAMVLLGYLFCRFSLMRRQKESERLALLQHENIRPVLHAVLQPAADAPHLIELSVSNHGKGTAYAVKLSIESIAGSAAADVLSESVKPLTAFSDGLDMLAAGETYGSVFAAFDTLASRSVPAPFNGIVKIVAHYKDALGLDCANESTLDIAVLGALQAKPASAGTAVKPRKKLLY